MPILENIIQIQPLSSYFIPTRTAAAGIIAAILGYERDSYYDKFRLNNCNIGIIVNNKIKKANHCMNYLKVENKNDLNGSKGRTQIPFEIVLPENLKDKENGYVSYRIFYSSNEKMMQALYKKIDSKEYNPITLGTASFSAFIENCELYEDVKPRQTDGEFVEISSVIPVNKIHAIDSRGSGEKIMMLTETIPYEFDDNRVLTAVGEVLFTIDSKPILVKLGKPYYTINDQNVVFIE